MLASPHLPHEVQQAHGLEPLSGLGTSICGQEGVAAHPETGVGEGEAAEDIGNQEGVAADPEGGGGARA